MKASVPIRLGLAATLFATSGVMAGCDPGEVRTEYVRAIPAVGGDAGASDSAADGGTAWEWKSCPLYLNDPWGKLAECASIPVPLRWDEPDGPTIDIFVQRYRPKSETKRGQLWLLQGGPGGSSAVFDAWMEEFGELEPEWDLYAIDHRGVGRSARLGCEAEEAPGSEGGIGITEDEWPACLADLEDQWGDDLSEFTITAAARDLGRVIEETRQPDEEVFVYGVSYGTTWAHRYMQIHPDQATGVILDSLAIHIWITNYDLHFNQVGEDLIDLCAADAFCSSKLGTDPWGFIGALFDQIDQGHCPAVFEQASPATPRQYLRWLLGNLLMEWNLRQLIPPVVYRLDRCAPADVTALQTLHDQLFETEPTYVDELDSDSLGHNILLSEFWPTPPPAYTELQSIAESAYTSIDVPVRVGRMYAPWPRYDADSFFGSWAAPTSPVLMMQGDLDPQTPYWVAEPVREAITGADKYFVTLPRAPHGVLYQSPTGAQSEPCGRKIMRSFLADPAQEPDTSCLAAMLAVEFEGDPLYANYYLGTENAWEDVLSARPTQPALPPPEHFLARRIIRSQPLPRFETKP